MKDKIALVKLVFSSNQKFDLNVINGKLKAISPITCGAVVSLLDKGGVGAKQCMVEVKFNQGGFTFFPSAVNKNSPILVKGVAAITLADDDRNFEQIQNDILSLGLKTDRERLESSRETSFNTVKNLKWERCPTFMTAFGNVNIWEAGFRSFLIEEKQHYDLYDYFIPRKSWDRNDFDDEATRVVYRYSLGRGMGVKRLIRRHNYKNYYPSLIAEIADNGVNYTLQAFCDTKAKILQEDEGTHYLNADLHSAATALTDEEKEYAKTFESEDTLLRVRVKITNNEMTSRVAYLRLPMINTPVMAEANKLQTKIDGGVGYYKDKIYMLCSVDGVGADTEECAFTVAPKQTIVVYMLLFHKPLQIKEALSYKAEDFEDRLNLAEIFWRDRIGSLGNWTLPEKRVENALKIGYFHLLQGCYGKNGSDAFAPTAGVYPPIGSESSPIIQFLDSVGDGDMASKGLNYFFQKQKEDGFIQNIAGYMLENGATLYNAGLHYYYTKDISWLNKNKEQIIKATDYILRWINRNNHGEIGYGMIDGQVADPEDTFRSYALNAFAYAGLKKSAEMYSAMGLDCQKVADEAKTLKQNIQNAFRKCMQTSPLVPLKDGTWVPAVAPWAEGRGAISLHTDGASCFSHAAHVLKDSLLSLHFLVYYGVFDKFSEEGKMIIDYMGDLYFEDNTALSQPYYSLVPLINLQRGEKKAFLSEYYSAFASIADRETYSFWEHTFLATPHKTHEQAWFLMRTRFMLYREEGDTLVLFGGVPEDWKKDNGKIYLEKACCYFGKFTLTAKYKDGKCALSFISNFDGKVKVYGANGSTALLEVKKGKNEFTI